MTDEERREELATLCGQAAALRRSLTRSELPETSPAVHFQRLAKNERGESAIADRVVVVADLWTLIAGDQIGGLAPLIRSREVFSIFPLCRASIEHSCAVIWVLDPDPAVSPEARCARAALAIDRSNVELVTAAAHLGGKSSETYKERRQVMRDFRKAIATQFPDGTNVEEGVVANEPLAKPTEVMAHFGKNWGVAREWEGVYDYLCATANHPSVSGFEFVTQTDEGIYIEMPLHSLELFLRNVLIPFLKAIEHYATYCEWDTAEFDALVDRCNAAFDPPLLT
jgi:hypothetical protein